MKDRVRALIDAAYYRDLNEVKKLLDTPVTEIDGNRHMVDPAKVVSAGGATLLHIPALSGHKGIMKLFLELGLPVNAQDMVGDTPLHNAVMADHYSCMDLLLKNGANPNIRNANGSTPLHTAVAYSYSEIVKKLYAQGADPNIENKSGLTPLMLDMIVSNGRSSWLLLQEADKGIGIKPDLGKQDAKGMTALHHAAQKCPPAMIELLLKSGADPMIRNHVGKTAGDLAHELGRKDVFEILSKNEEEKNKIKEKKDAERHANNLQKLDQILKKPRQKRFP